MLKSTLTRILKGALKGASLRLGLLACLLCAACAAARAQEAAWMSHARKALEEYRAKNYAAFLEHAERAAQAGPRRHPWLMYHLARAYSLNGRAAEAARLLGGMADMGLGADAADNEDFRRLREAGEWAALSARIAAARVPLVRGRTAFVVREPDLLPEGIAYDPRRRAFYLGSLRSKIVRLDADGRKSDFKAAGEDGLVSVLGMKVDAARRLLWVCNNTRDGAAFLHKYDLDSGRLVKKYALDERPGARHQFNDIALGRRGDLYVTDSLGAAVYEIRAAADEPRLLVRLEPGVYPNGVALSRDGRRLYVASFKGVTLVDLRTKALSELARADDVALTGADGLYLYGDSLVAVQNANPAPDRVVRLFLNAGGDRVERARVVESNHPLYRLPTTGVVVGREFFYVANTQIDSMGAGGQISPAAKLRDLILLKVGLN